MGQGGKLRIEGAPVEEKEEKETGNKTQEDIYDAAGNKIDVKQNQKLSDKDAKKAIKDIEKKLKDAKKKKTLTDEEMWELEDKLAELKENLIASLLPQCVHFLASQPCLRPGSFYHDASDVGN